MESLKQELGPIVCATRGGKSCQSTQGHAIYLAKEQDAELIFLFVADAGFAGPLDEELSKALVDELERLGRSILHIAQKRARNQGMEAKVVVQRGQVRETIESYIRQVKARTLVIGSPESRSVRQEFTPDELNDFALAIQQATGVRVQVVN